MKLRFLLYVVTIVLGLASCVRAQPASADLIGMFPKNVSEVGYANLDRARQFSWFAQFKQQSLPTRFGEFEQFLSAPGADLASHIKEVIWARCAGDPDSNDTDKVAPSAEEIVGIASGDFDADSMEAAFRTAQVPSVEAGQSTLFQCAACADLFITFLDSQTVAFGERSALGLLVKARNGEVDNLRQNMKLSPLLEQENDDSVFWGVLGPHMAQQALFRIAPEISQFEQTGKYVAAVSGMAIRVRGADGIAGADPLEIDCKLQARTPGDISRLSIVFQAGLLLRQYQSAQMGDGLAGTLDATRMIPLGDILDISFSLSNDQLVDMVQHDTFAKNKQ
jgi:hypothetical protein